MDGEHRRDLVYRQPRLAERGTVRGRGQTERQCLHRHRTHEWHDLLLRGVGHEFGGHEREFGAGRRETDRAGHDSRGPDRARGDARQRASRSRLESEHRGKLLHAEPRDDERGPYSVIAHPSTTTYTDTGLTNGTTYYYEVSATNSAGTSANSAPVGAKPTAPVTIPAVPTGLAATPGNAQVGLGWSPSTGASSYTLSRATTSAGPYSVVAHPSTTTYTDTGLTNGTTYYYEVSATNSAGTSANSAPVGAKPTAPVTIPAVPTGLAATPGNAQVGLGWSPSTGASSYTLSRATTSAGPYSVVAHPSTTTYTDTGLTNGTTYYYEVSATNSAGTSANSAPVGAKPTAPVTIPAVPTGLAATPGNAQVGLGWSPSTGASSYTLSRATTSAGPYSVVAHPSTTTYTDTGLTNGTTYYYEVSATNSAGTSANSAPVGAKPTAPVTIPAVPTGLAATPGNAQVGLGWSPSTGATSYTVSRSTASAGPFAVIAKPTATGYTDTGLSNGTTYYYEVSATNSAGTSANSAPVGVTPTAPVVGANLKAPLGMNVTALNYYSNEMPFLNSFKTAGPYNDTANSGWITQNAGGGETNEEAYLQVDANGYPTTMAASSADPNSPQQFSQIVALFMRNFPYTPSAPSGTNGYYPGGYYAVLYDGQGTLTYGADAKFVSTSATATGGRDLISVNPSAGGIYVRITSTDPNGTGNYLRNIRVVQTGSDGTATPGSNEAALANGQIFTQQFMNLMSPFSVIRFMQWFNLDSSRTPNTLSSWSNRPQVANATYTGPSTGVPYEIPIALANAVSASPWLNIPVEATNDFITQFGNLTAKTLNPPLKLYVELSNEVWNSGFPSYSYAVAQGKIQFPNVQADLQYPFYYATNWYGMRSAQTCDLIKAAWKANGADTNRIVCVISGQTSYTAVALEELSCPFWVAQGNTACGNHVAAVAIGPYFGGFVPNAWAEAPLVNGQGSGLDSLFDSLTTQNDPSIPVGGWLGQVSTQVTKLVTQLAATAKTAGFPDLPVIAYEAGQDFIPFNPGNGVYEAPLLTDYINLYGAANLDPRMGTAYTEFLDTWRQNGAQLMMLFADVGEYGEYGEFGAVQSVMQPLSPLSATPPKWQAIQDFIANNPCWWGTATSPCAP